jgi:CxxC-x17-CxxC domain-containing protein
MEENNEINFFGLTSFRSQKKKFGIKTDDRRRHFYCIGKTGMGKSNLMENMAIQDIQKGRGIAYVDPHGEGAEKLLDFVPSDRVNDVVFFNPADLDYPIAFNVMEKVDFRYRHLVAGGLMGVFKKVWPDVWSARMEYILNNSILALLEYPDSTLLGINRMLADPEYRQEVVSKITDPIVKSFWVTEYARYTQRYEIEATAAIQNKVGQFISNPLIRNIIGQTKSTINMREIMDGKKIFIIDLSKGRIGEDNSRLLGALLITKLQLAAMSRVDILEAERKDFYLYVDEFQNFATESFANILSEARKYRLNITLGHQYINQMDEIVRDAVFGNVGTLAVFRVGAEDAEFLEKEFSPEFTATDLVNLPKYNIYLKLMIDGISGHPFSAQTLPPPEFFESSNREKIINASRERYGVKREIVEEKISIWSGINQEDENKEANHRKQNKIEKNEGQNNSTILYDAICSNCNKSIKVIFPPEKGRPVYCKNCLKKIKSKDGSDDSVIDAEKNFTEKKSGAEDFKKENWIEGSKNSDTEKDGGFEIENISFGKIKSDRRISENIKQKEHKRKEINLSELRKVIKESLNPAEENFADKDNLQEKDENKQILLDSPANKDNRIENAILLPGISSKSVRKKEIKPGEKIKL